MPTRRARAIGLATTFVVLGLAPLGAQCAPDGPPNPRATRRSIVGLVLDQYNRPIENAEVVIRTPRRQDRSRADGWFRLADLDTGTYEITVRRIGYEITAWNYVVTDSGGVARFCLVPEMRILPPTITAVKAGGLSGVIGDSLMKPLPDAEVRAMGRGVHTKTDSTGSFFLDLRSGTYALVISKKGYARQLMSVTIPKDSGRQITAFLGSPPPNANRVATTFDAMRERMLWAVPSRSGIMSNEDLMKTSADLRGAAQRTARAGVVDDCPAIINGGPYTLPVYMIDKRDVALMEAYAAGIPRASRSRVNSRSGGSGPTGAGGVCNVRIYVWMKP